MKRQNLMLTVGALAVLFLLPAVGKADPITLVLDPSHNVAQGASVTFMGTLSNGGNPSRFINGTSLTITGPAGITFDDTAFFLNVPATLGPGTTTGLVSFFDIFVDLTVGSGVYTGSFSVLGGDTDSADSILATQEFTIIVSSTAPAPGVPEPATMVLLSTGLAGAALAKRRRRRQCVGA